MTKSFGALAILMLRDEGKLALDTAAAVRAGAAAACISHARQYADHRATAATMAAGWPEDNPWGDRQLWRNDTELREILRRACLLPMRRA